MSKKIIFEKITKLQQIKRMSKLDKYLEKKNSADIPSSNKINNI